MLIVENYRLINNRKYNKLLKLYKNFSYVPRETSNIYKIFSKNNKFC